eukprot:gene23680-47017_t
MLAVDASTPRGACWVAKWSASRQRYHFYDELRPSVAGSPASVWRLPHGAEVSRWDGGPRGS